MSQPSSHWGAENLIFLAILLFHGCGATSQTNYSNSRIFNNIPIIIPALSIGTICINIGNYFIELAPKKNNEHLPLISPVESESLHNSSSSDRNIAIVNQFAGYVSAGLMWWPHLKAPYWAMCSLPSLTYWLNSSSRSGLNKWIQNKDLTSSETLVLRNAWLAMWGIFAQAFTLTQSSRNMGSQICYLINGVSSIYASKQDLSEQYLSLFQHLKRPVTLIPSLLLSAGIVTLFANKEEDTFSTIILMSQILALVGTYGSFILHLGDKNEQRIVPENYQSLA